MIDLNQITRPDPAPEQRPTHPLALWLAVWLSVFAYCWWLR